MADIITVETTASVAMAYSLAPGFAFELIEFTLHLNAAATTAEDFTVTKNISAGSGYDTLVYKNDIATNSITDIYFSCEDNEFIFEDDDTLDFAWSNSDLKTYSMQIKYRRKT